MNVTHHSYLRTLRAAALGGITALACGGNTHVTVIVDGTPDAAASSGGRATGGSGPEGAGGRVEAGGSGGADTGGVHSGGRGAMDAGAGGSAGNAADSGAGGSLLDSGAGGDASRDATPDVAAPVPDAQAGDAGPCVPFTNRCHDHNRETCQATGGWSVSDVCSLDTQICRSGACVTNNPYALGYDTVDGTWTSFTFPQSSVYFMPIVIPTTATTVAAQVLPNVSQGTGRMYLYTDAGGAPGTLIGIAGNFPMGIVNSSNTIIPVSPATSQLTAGQTYWLGGEFFLSGSSVKIWQKPASSSPLYVLTHTFGAAMPNPFNPAAASKVSGLLSYSLVVRDVP